MLFIAAPKTGSTSVESFLSEVDPFGERFKFQLDGQIIDSTFVRSGSLGHATAREFKAIFGAARYSTLHTIGLVRHPIEKLLSTYFFTRDLKFSGLKDSSTAKSKVVLLSRKFFAMALAKAFPFRIWALMFPMKKCSEYFLDENGELIVDFLGATDRLGSDLREIATLIGLDIEYLQVPHVNKSNRSDLESTLTSDGILHRLMRRRFEEDLKLYALVADGIYVSGRPKESRK